MSYQQALKRIESLAEEQKWYQEEIKNNAILRNLNMNPAAKISIPLSMSMARTISAMGIKSDPGTALHAVSPYAGMALAGLMPLRAGTTLLANKQRMTELRGQEELLKNSPTQFGIADSVKSVGIGARGFSQSMMNTYIAMMAMGSLLPGAEHLKTAALLPYGASGLTGGPLRAMMTIGGFSKYFSGAASNPITAGLSTLLSGAGAAGSTVLGGAGKLAGMAHFSGLAKALGTAGTGFEKFMSGKAAGALTGDPLAMMAAVGLMMGLTPVVNKGTNFLKEMATGTKLLKSGSAMRPIVTPAHQIQKMYSQTIMLDKQIDMQGQMGNLDFKWWALLKFAAATERNTSQLGFMAEFFQNKQNEKSVSGNLAQNSIQSLFGQTGYQEFTSGALTPEEEFLAEISTDSPLVQWFKRKKYGLAKAAQATGRGLELIGSFFNPMDYIAGGENNPFVKYRKFIENDEYNQTITHVSRITGIPPTFLQALETTSTQLLDKGDTVEAKQLTILGGMYELIRFSAFQLKDIARAMGVDQEDSFMGKMASIMEDAQEKAGENNDSMLSRTVKWLGGSRLGAILGGAAGFAATGGLGAIIGMALPALIAGKWDEFQRGDNMFGLGKSLRTKLTYQESLDTLNPSDYSLDTTQQMYLKEHEIRMEKEAKAKYYTNIQDIRDAMLNEEKGINIRFSRPGNDRLDQFTLQFKNITKFLDNIEENTDWLEEELILLNRCCGFGMGFNGRRRRGAGVKNRGRRRTGTRARYSWSTNPRSNQTQHGSVGTMGSGWTTGTINTNQSGGSGWNWKSGARLLGRGAVAGTAIAATTIASSAILNDGQFNVDAGTLGAIAGGVLGAFVPFLGPFIGPLLGSVVGEFAGTALGNWLDKPNKTDEARQKGINNTKHQLMIQHLKARFMQNHPHLKDVIVTKYHGKEVFKADNVYYDMRTGKSIGIDTGSINKSRFERKHSDVFGVWDEARHGTEYIRGKSSNRLYALWTDDKTGKQVIYDVATNKKIMDYADTEWIVNKETKASDFIKEYAKNIKGMKGDKNKVDTQEEFEALIDVMLKTNQISNLSAEQQTELVELIRGLLTTTGMGHDFVAREIRALAGKLGVQAPPIDVIDTSGAKTTKI